jgi:hypothetical protein
MPDYRLVIHGQDGQVTGPAQVVSAADDAEAIARAEAVRGVLAAELWDFDGPRLVKRLEALSSQAPYPQSTIDRGMQSDGQA